MVNALGQCADCSKSGAPTASHFQQHLVCVGLAFIDPMSDHHNNHLATIWCPADQHSVGVPSNICLCIDSIGEFLAFGHTPASLANREALACTNEMGLQATKTSILKQKSSDLHARLSPAQVFWSDPDQPLICSSSLLSKASSLDAE